MTDILPKLEVGGCKIIFFGLFYITDNILLLPGFEIEYNM